MLEEPTNLYEAEGNPPLKKVVFSSPLSAIVSQAITPTISTLVDCLLQSIGTTLISLPKLDAKDQSLAIANLTRSLSQLQSIQKMEEIDMGGMTTEELETYIASQLGNKVTEEVDIEGDDHHE